LYDGIAVAGDAQRQCFSASRLAPLNVASGAKCAQVGPSCHRQKVCNARWKQERILQKQNERTQYVSENKGPMWEAPAQGANVYENKGS
jgi:hypothetical protein